MLLRWSLCTAPAAGKVTRINIKNYQLPKTPQPWAKSSEARTGHSELRNVLQGSRNQRTQRCKAS